MEFRATSTGTDLDKLTSQAAKALRGAQRTLGRDIAKAGRRAIMAEVRARRRGGTSFSGMKSKKGAGVRLGASTTVKPGTQLVVTISAKPPGPWSIVEHGAVEHEIKPKKGRAGRDGRPAALEFSGLYSSSVWHPGASARPVWWFTEPALDAAVTPIIDEAMGDLIEEAMD